MLKIETYEAQERKAIAQLPNRVVEMVQPVTFSTVGYPTRVSGEKELWKYLDCMHETRFEQDFENLIGGGITESEFELLKKTATLALEFSLHNYNRKLTTRGSLLRALHVYRCIKDIFGNTPGRVFEIGPGSGYLGNLFLLTGWGYAASDITQAFYLIQNQLWNYLKEEKVKDLAEDPTWDTTIPLGTAVHLPWWDFYDLLNRNIPSVDIVTCNHALVEMHPNSLRYMLRVAKKMLSGSGIKAFVFEGWGNDLLVKHSQVTEQFYKAGFRLVHNDDKITIFVPKDNQYSHPAANLPFRFAIKQRVIPALKARLGFSSNISRFSPPKISMTQNTLSQNVLVGHNRRCAEKLIRIEEVNKFYTDLLNTDDFRTPDEVFCDLIGINYH